MDNAVPFPLPGVRRFRQLGFGMFVHFGLYSQPERGVRVFRDIPEPVRDVRRMDSGEALDFRQRGASLEVRLTGFSCGQNLCVRVARVTLVPQAAAIRLGG